MGSKLINRQSRLLNTPFEFGLRILFILCNTSLDKINLQRLIYYDYAVKHSNDLLESESSLHSLNPYRSSEWIDRREIIRKGMSFFIQKGLIDINYTSKGIFYKANNLTHYYIEHFQSKYALKLKYFSKEIANKLDKLTLNEIEEQMKQNIGKWGMELSNSVNGRLINE